MKRSIIFFCLLLTLVVNRSHAQKRSPLLPDFAVAQYAGSIGYLSGGIGYDVLRNRGRVSAHFGSVPRSQGGPLDIFCAKFFVEPWTIAMSEKFTFNPLDVGVMVSYHTGADFKENIPNYLAERNYYWFNTNMRLHV